jgi:hypothetical protein
MTRATARRGTFGPVAAVAALVMVLSACNGGGGDGVASAGGEENPADPGKSEESAPLDADEQALVFAACMRDNGVDMPDPGPGQEGLAEAFQAVAGNYDPATLDRAIAVCEDLMPEYASEEEHDDEWILEVAECLRDQGLDVSDDPFEDAHRGEIDVGEFSEAMEVCRDVLINGGP